MATVLSGVCWGKLSFGFPIFYDSKILAYVFLPIFLIYLYLTPPRPGILCWGTGLFLLCQERLSTYFLNSLHQVFILDMFSDSEFTVKTISLGKATIVILALAIFCLKI